MSFQIIKKLPKNLTPNQLINAVEGFIRESGILENPADFQAIFDQTITNISLSTLHATDDIHHFWLWQEGTELKGYVLAYVGIEADGSKCYWMTQAWVDPKYRRTPGVKDCVRELKRKAKELGCKHVIIPTNRNIKAYCRFMGQKWKPYLTLIKEDL